jgi:TonB family protein
MTKFCRAILLALLSTAACLAMAASPPPKEIVLRAYLDMDAQGRVTGMEWPHMDPKAKPLTDRLEAAVRRWEFEPGSVNGVPAATRTGLTLLVGAGKDAQGGLTLSVLKAYPGAVSDQMVIPRYPMEQARAGHTAALSLLLEVDESGKVTNATVTEYRLTSRASAKAAKARTAFETASREAVMQWKFSPERVAGKALASRVRVPIDFCMDSGPCRPLSDKDKKDKVEADTASLPSGTAVALDSVVKIKTQIGSFEI